MIDNNSVSKPGRPVTGHALTPAERARNYRLRKKHAQLNLIDLQKEFNQLREQLLELKHDVSLLSQSLKSQAGRDHLKRLHDYSSGDNIIPLKTL